MTLYIVFAIAIVLVIIVIKLPGNKKIIPEQTIPEIDIKKILTAQVLFFNKLNQADQEIFIARVLYFLATTKISPEKGAIITDEHRVLVAASATIPLFHFDQWSYENLDEVIIYPDYFNEKFDVSEKKRSILGMVGDGAMHRKMILSLPALLEGYSRYATSNTAIHEFVHLIDKADGAIDGVPEYLIPKELVQPWLQEMHETIQEIHKNKSDIRDYAATNEAEFLAVVSEYFFQKPKMLQEDHPELFSLLNEIYGKHL
ncbi:zinc-dependent peptidase [Sphingobacterium sp. HJSM2_6]|uniref:M90 family metallopeptidase n=1 Tax=Sphingobacterium sp. HJSM2_6 TaxID=3366264 RepID=UPI003BC54FD2